MCVALGSEDAPESSLPSAFPPRWSTPHVQSWSPEWKPQIFTARPQGNYGTWAYTTMKTKPHSATMELARAPLLWDSTGFTFLLQRQLLTGTFVHGNLPIVLSHKDKKEICLILVCLLFQSPGDFQEENHRRAESVTYHIKLYVWSRHCWDWPSTEWFSSGWQYWY